MFRWSRREAAQARGGGTDGVHVGCWQHRWLACWMLWRTGWPGLALLGAWRSQVAVRRARVVGGPLGGTLAGPHGVITGTRGRLGVCKACRAEGWMGYRDISDPVLNSGHPT